MTPTSATCRNSRPVAGFASGRGFTLLELVVVLALLALATALVAPSGFRMIASWRNATDVDTALDAISGLGHDAARDGRARTLDAGPVADDVLVGLPEGWQVVLDTPLRIQANGACDQSYGRIIGPEGYEQPFGVQAPFCRTARGEGAP